MDQQIIRPSIVNHGMNTNFTENHQPVDGVQNNMDSKSKSSRSSLNQFTWRICLSSGSEFDNDNNLISPWKWMGTVRHVHEQWLKAWLNSKRECKDTDYSRSYYWKDLSWELCKAVYPEVWYVPTPGKSKPIYWINSKIIYFILA